ncbi:hypothetical protein BSKO_09462 [Bryopsis sp. KO-2023]|nr:hypothetical protein BSKO_09462 [Bryopsis sp. KO-2023]
MDEGNVHQLWGFSPALDLLAVREEIPESLQETTTTSKPSEIFRSLQVCPNDCRHTVTTLCRTSRHLSEGTDSEGIEIVVYEECIENLARHILLVLVLLDENLSVRDRVETFLELHGNVFIQEKTEAYLEALGKRLERFVSNYPRDSAIEKLYGVFDLSQLNYKERDALVEVFRGYRSDGKYSLEKGWESRLRNFYGDRFDFKKNMIDWDYHMRLCRRGCCGQANEGGKNDGSIVHFYHFREWRSSGVAYEFRDCVYKRPNRSLLTTTIGKSIFCKDRSLQDVGKTVSAKGYWGDVANSPYHCFGAVCEDQSFFKKSNRQFMKTAVDVAEFNVEAMIDELRTGRRFSTQQQKEETPAASESKPPPLDSQQSTSQVEKTEEIAPPESPNPEEPLQGQSPPDSHPESGQKEVDPAATEPPSTSALKEKENQCGKENKDGATTTNQASDT